MRAPDVKSLQGLVIEFTCKLLLKLRVQGMAGKRKLLQWWLKWKRECKMKCKLGLCSSSTGISNKRYKRVIQQVGEIS